MLDVNSCTISGRLTADPEERRGEKTIVCRFTVAVNKRMGAGKEKTNFVPVVVFGRDAEICLQHLSKGREVAVKGDLDISRYEKDGNSRLSVEVRADRVDFGGGGSKPKDNVEEAKRGVSKIFEKSRG